MSKMSKVASVALLLLSFVPSVASRAACNFKGTIVAYDPVYHGLKQPSFVRNLEVTIADVTRKRGHRRLVKLIFEGFGAQQVPDDVLEGRTHFNVRAIRDASCDEDHPRVLSEVDPFQGSGAFLLNQTHRVQGLDGISHLDCYRVRVGK